MMYDYRKMSDAERRHILKRRRLRHQPKHSPPHWGQQIGDYFLITAACYEHLPVVGKSSERLTECEAGVLSACHECGTEIFAWCILPNHYHLLLRSESLTKLCRKLGEFHGRSSYCWNQEDEQTGRHVWYRCFDRAMRSERHFWTTLNYVHNNPVQHGYVDKWQDWTWSSAATFLKTVGRSQTLEIWRRYPLLDYGKKWDIY